MRQAIKKQNPVKACRLGGGSTLEKQLLAQGKLKQVSPHGYEVFSREALGAHGEHAAAGDYVKVDSQGFPYPNGKAFFEANHRMVGPDTYVQLGKPVFVWFFGDVHNEIIEFLQQQKALVIRPEEGFTAPLWGTVLTAKADAAIVIYGVERNAGGQITNVEFNFVARDEFDRTYRFITE